MWIYCKILFISVMRSCIFSIITPVFSVTWSSEIIIICWFTAQETWLLSMLSMCYFIFLWKLWYILFFRILWLIKHLKQHLFEKYIFCNIINVFTVTLDQLIASLLNKTINFFQKASVNRNIDEEFDQSMHWSHVDCMWGKRSKRVEYGLFRCMSRGSVCMCECEEAPCILVHNSLLFCRYSSRRCWSWARSCYPPSTLPPVFPEESLTWAGEHLTQLPPFRSQRHMSQILGFLFWLSERKRRVLALLPPTWLPLVHQLALTAAGKFN